MRLPVQLVETAQSREFIISTIIFMLLALNFNSWTVWSDGHAYFAILESIVQDRDFDLTNQVQQYGEIYLVTAFATTPERFSSPYGFGTPVLNAPLYSTALAIEKTLNINITYNGYGLLRTAAVNLSANIFALLAMLFCFTTIKKLKLKLSQLSMLCLVVSTPLFFYASMTPSFPHAADAFVLSAFIMLFVFSEKEKWKEKEQLALGLLLGFATSVRYYNATLLVPTMLFFAWQKQWKKTIFFLFGFAAFAWTIPVYWQLGMGEQGTETAVYLANDIAPGLFPVNAINLLISQNHGLLVWSPIIIFSLFGLYLLFKEKQNNKIAVFLAGIFLTMVIAYGRTEIWSAGWSYSNRYLTGMFPIFSIGFAAFEKHFGKKARIIAIACLLYSAFLLLNEAFAFIDGVKGTPTDVFNNWAGGKTTIEIFLKEAYKFSLLDNIAKAIGIGT